MDGQDQQFPPPPWVACERPNGESCIAICAGSYDIEGIEIVDARDIVLRLPCADGNEQEQARAIALAKYICGKVNSGCPD